MLETENALILVMDSLSPRYLGCYGNTWVETPAWNHLAAHSLLMENAIVGSTSANENLISLVTGQHPVYQRQSGAQLSTGDLPSIQSLREAGWFCTLFSDTPLLDDPATAPIAESFDEFSTVAQPTSDAASESIEGSHLAQCFAELIDMLTRQAPPFCVVAYLRSLTATWDAPYDWRIRLADPEDPTPADFTIPPQSIESDDPDELLGYWQAYAAQIQLLDACLAVLMDSMAESGQWDDLYLMLTATRGFPLGEHRLVGHHEHLLNGESIHVPFMIRSPRPKFYPRRRHQVVNAAAGFPSVLESLMDRPRAYGQFQPLALEGTVDAEIPEALCVNRAGEPCLWTPDWALIDHDSEPLLYVKPDDRWEVNPVADKCPDIVSQLRESSTRIRDQLLKGQKPGPASKPVDF